MILRRLGRSLKWDSDVLLFDEKTLPSRLRDLKSYLVALGKYQYSTSSEKEGEKKRLREG